MNSKYFQVCMILNEMMGNVSASINAYESLPRRVITKKKIKKKIK